LFSLQAVEVYDRPPPMNKHCLPDRFSGRPMRGWYKSGLTDEARAIAC
jgi:hypothetical protein